MRSGVAHGALVAVAAAALAAGCGGGRKAPPPEPVTAPLRPYEAQAAEQFLAEQLAPVRRTAAVVPAGYRVRRLTDAGFAVAFPPDWQVLQHRDAVWPGVIPTLAHVNRGLAPYLAALVTPDSPLKLFGFDRRTMHGVATTATVIVSRQRHGAAYADWSPAVLEELRGLRGVGAVEGRHLTIPAGDAMLVQYRRGSIGTLQLFAVRGDSIVTLTLTARAASVRRYRSMFLRVARSLDLSVPVLHP